MDAEIERITKKGGEGHSALDANFTVAQALKVGRGNRESSNTLFN